MSAEVRRPDRSPVAVADVRRYEFRPSHAALLKARAAATSPPPDRVPCDAILVPSHAHPERLGPAADLAARLGCVLVVMCTSDRHAAIVRRLSRRLRQPRVTVILSFDWPAPMPLDGLLTPHEPGATSDKHRDVAAKRNTGLALARMLRWRRMLFIDDDVRNLRPPSVRAACHCLGSPDLQAVSWHLRRFEDNSVVCHARRLSRLDQDIFIGGGALAVNVTRRLPIFPPVYNEDWLFLHQLLADRAVAVGGDVRQLRFDPFGAPERAREEEFGDILAEGMFHLLHEHVDASAAENAGYWAGVVEVRRALVAELRAALGARRRHPGWPRRPGRARIERALVSLEVSSHAHAADELPDHLASFVGAWQKDLATWHAWYADLPRRGGLDEAMVFLNLPDCSLTVIEGSAGGR